MRYLFFTNTPAHVHLYKHTVERLKNRGHEVLVLGRRYGCTEELLSFHDLPYRIYGSCATTKGSLFWRLPGHYLRAFRAALRFGPDYVFGCGGYAAHTGAVVRAPTVLVHDSEPTSLDHAVSQPLARAILTPHAFEKDLGANHYRFHGFKELAYLHPSVYEPKCDIRDAIGVGPEEPYVLLRFNAFGSHHDVGHSGFSPTQREMLIERFAEHAIVFVSDESGTLSLAETPARPFDLHPALMHDTIAEASLLVADTQTMVTEAALLGTPAIRSNSFVGDGDMGNFLELERHDLIYNHRMFEDVLDTGLGVLTDGDSAERWRRKRTEYLADKVNLTNLLVEVATNVEALDELKALSGERSEPVTSL
jgi:predicted glycosyltransferase